MQKAFERPPAIYVFCTAKPTKKNGMTETMTWRVGTCHRESEIPAMIAKERRDMGQTFGGLIEPASMEGRTYRAFRAKWTEIEVKL